MTKKKKKKKKLSCEFAVLIEFDWIKKKKK